MAVHDHAEVAPGPGGEASVVLDIGSSRGAVVVVTPPSLADLEIEIRPADGRWDGTHTGIRRRDLRDTVAYAGVFGSLEAGAYQLRLRGAPAGGPGAGTVVDLQVVGGEVTQVEWPEVPAPAPGPAATTSLPVPG
jgi:hypothetical protein